MTIGKEEMANQLLDSQYEHISSKSRALNIVDDVMAIISEALLDGNKVRLNEVGILETVTRAPRKGVGFGKEYDKPASVGVSFKLSKVLKERLNAE